MNASRYLIAGLVTLCSTTALASFIPHGWEKSGKGIWLMGFQGAYYSQSDNLADVEDLTVVNGNPSNAELLFPFLNESPSDQWGYTVNLGYIFPSHRHDLQASYTWLNADASKSAEGIVGILSDYAPVSPINSQASFDDEFEEAELTLGTFKNIDEKLLFRIGAGLVYTNITQKSDHTQTSGHVLTQPIRLEGNGMVNNHFEGIGPKLTFDGHYDFTRYFTVLGGFGISGVFGNSSGKINFKNTASFANVPAYIDAASVEEYQGTVALGLDGKLGLRFEQTIEKHFAWNIEAGYQATTYLNAMQDLSLDMTVIGGKSIPPTVDYVTEKVEMDSDYYNYGPYVSVSVFFQ